MEFVEKVLTSIFDFIICTLTTIGIVALLYTFGNQNLRNSMDVIGQAVVELVDPDATVFTRKETFDIFGYTVAITDNK